VSFHQRFLDWSAARVVLHIDIRAALDEQMDKPELSGSRSQMQRGLVAVVTAICICAMREENLNNFPMSLL
jgi:hypothetical protein